MVPADVRSADDALEAHGRLVRLYEELKEQGPIDWLDNLAELQAEAEMIREWHPTLIPGLLQTEGYARAVVSAGAPWRTPESVTATVEHRLRTASRVLGQTTPHYHVVIDDVAALRPVGSLEVMAGQLRRLIELVESHRVMLQFHRFDLWPHAGLDGPYSVLSSASAPDTVHMESVYRGQTTDEPKSVRQFAMSFSHLQASARGPRDTVEFLRTKIKEYEDG